MTKKLTSTKTLMELDLNSFIHSDSDDDSDSVPHRTIDEILNASDSSTSSSPPPSPSSIHHHRRPQSDIFPSKSESLLLQYDVVSQEPAQSLKPQSSSFTRVNDPIRRVSSSSSSSSSRQLPALFSGVRSNAKPGAALAAAVAASRSVPTPHAAAIKSRRAGSGTVQKVLDDQELGPNAVEDHEISSSTVESIGVVTEASRSVADYKLGDFQSISGEFSSGDVVLEGKRESGGDFVGVYKEAEVEEVRTSNIWDDGLVGTCESRSSSKFETVIASVYPSFDVDDSMLDSRVISSGNVKNERVSLASSSEISTCADMNDSDRMSVSSSPLDAKDRNIEENLTIAELDKGNLDKGMIDHKNDEVGGGDGDDDDDDDGSSMSDISELVEERLGQLESERINKRAEKKFQASKKPLELAEELEKKQASTGLHWEEGAAAQPMRLEGVRRGSTTLGYFDIDTDNTITRTISSQAFRRDHGSPQVLTVHLNYIAVGMSKGVIVVVPSKYSTHGADNMESKMLFLGLQAERCYAPVTSMCFNQQGDLLLAGYGDGHITVWDVQRVSAAKVITGEHKAPVVHTLFLGQDLQISRQFKAVTGDSKGLVLLHAFSVVPLLNRFSIKTQCLLDGQRTGIVLSASSLLLDESCGGALSSSQGNSAVSSGSIGSMMGGVVGGDAGWKLFNEGSSLNEEGVVIFVTYQTALVVRLSPTLEVYAQLSRPEGVRKGSMPCTAWKCVMQSCTSSAESASTEAAERVSLLAIAWDRKVQVAKLVKSELKVYGKWSIDSAAIGVAWLDDQLLVVLTLTGQLYFFAKDGTVIHQTNFGVNGSAGDDLVAYHTYFTNVFGNPEKAFHNCIAVRGASIYILGNMHLIVSRLLPWKERIHVLRRAGDWMGALNMAMTLYDGQAHGVIDLPRALDDVQEAIMPHLVELLLSYVDEVFSYISVAFCNQIEKVENEPVSRSTSLHSEIKEQYARVVGVAVEFCIHIKRTNILFDEIFSRFLAVHQRETFLELLEPYILKDMLGSLPPEIMQALVEHYSSKGWLQRVEQCVLHMDISSLDFNQVVRLCREHGLYGALVYLFNKGLDDFRAPLEELLVVLRNSHGESAVALGYRMLVYLKYCFSGLAFPPGQGTLPPTRLPSLRTELLQFLLEDSDARNSQAASDLVFGGACLNLYHLLKLDTEATLDVLRCAFVEDETPKADFSFSESAYVNSDGKGENKLMAESQNILVQKTIDSLVHIVDGDVSKKVGSTSIEDAGSAEAWPSKKDLGHLFEFIAYYVACCRSNISKRVFTQILEYLTSENNFPSSASSKKRENQLLALLKVLPEFDWDGSYVLHLCEKAHFYQVCGFIYTMRHQNLSALDSYMRDVDEPIHAFSFIHEILQQLSGNELAAFRSAVISRISQLVDLNRECAFFLVIDCFNDESSDILSGLNSHPKSLFLYLKTIIEVHLSGTLDFSKLRKDDDVNVDDSYRRRVKDSSKRLKAYLERISDFPKFMRNNPVNVTDDMIELYLELLCQFERDSVLKFLETFDSYRVEHCLRLCQEYGIVDAAAFLLERVGDVGSALVLTLSGLDDKFMELDAAVLSLVSNSSLSESATMTHLPTVLNFKEVNDIFDVLHASIGLCKRNTPRLNPEESETLWFHLLDTFSKPIMGSYADQRKSERESHNGILDMSLELQEDEGACIIKWRISNSCGGVHILRKLFSQFIKEIVEEMIGYVRLPSIMSKLLSDNGSQEFGDFKLTILGMLGTYGFERRILDTAKSLIEADTFYTMSLLKKGASHGYAPRNFLCCICNCLLTKNSSSLQIRVFNCGHATHLQCELLENEPSSRASSGCPVCMPKKNMQRSRNKSAAMEDGLVSKVSSRVQPSQRAMLYQHESDVLENSYRLQQVSRFDILSNLQKGHKLVQLESMPQLRLAPPAVYHEKVKKETDHFTGESSSDSAKIDKPTKNRRYGELNMKGSSLRLPRFGKEKTRAR